MNKDKEKYIERFYKGDKDQTLEKMRYLVNQIGNPEKTLKIIHITGTNGKGSTTEMLSNILIKQGYTVGKLISPHLIKINERISVNNINISNEEMIDIFNLNNELIKRSEKSLKKKVTFQELMLLTALIHFKNKKCEFAVIEVGLGGKYDATNIVNPIVSVISSIGYDHINILGNTLEEIAKNKAGIIKKNSNTVFIKQEDNVNEIIINACKSNNNKLTLIDLNDVKNYSFNDKYQKFNYKEYENIEINLKGIKQINNSILALETINILKKNNINISKKAIERGLKTVIHKARFETVNESPKIIFDGGHNEDAIKNFINSVNMYYKNESKVYIFSALKRKDYKKMLEIMIKNEKNTDTVFIFHDGIEKSLDKKMEYVRKEELHSLSRKVCNNNIYKMSFENSICFANEKFKNRVIFIIGSFYLYEDTIKIIKKLNNDKK